MRTSKEDEINQAMTEWLAQAKNENKQLVEVPDDLKCRITEIAIPEGVKKIGSHLCRRAPRLRRVAFPASLEVLNGGAFEECEKLETVEFAPESQLRQFGGPDYSAPFYRCDSLKELALPDGLERINECGFLSMHGLETVILPKSVQTIGLDAFLNCNRLQTVLFEGRSMEEIRNMEFYPWCITDPDSVIQPGGLLAETKDASEIEAANARVRAFIATHGCQHSMPQELKHCVTEIAIPEGPKSIGDSFCQRAEYLKKVTFPASMEVLDGGAFSNCTALETVEFAPGCRLHRFGGVAYYAPFYGCNSLRELVLPDSLEEVFECGFSWMERLETVVLPESVERIGRAAFMHCPSLQTVIFEGKNVNEIEAMVNYPWGITDPGSTIQPGSLLAEAQVLENGNTADKTNTITENAMAGWSRMCSVFRN